MDSGTLTAIAIGLGCFVVPLIAGYALGKRQQWTGFIALLALAIVAALWLFFQARTVQGWDSFGYLIGLVLLALPSILGLLIGAGVAALRHARRSAPLAPPPDPE